MRVADLDEADGPRAHRFPSQAWMKSMNAPGYSGDGAVSFSRRSTISGGTVIPVPPKA